MNAIEIHDLSKNYPGHLGRSGTLALDSLNLSVEENEVVGFLGKNGAGKTTTIKILCGLIRATRGTATIFGESIRKRSTRKLVGFLPENPYFYEYLTPKETLDFYGLLAGLSQPEREREWDMLADRMDLRDIADQRIREFSKGMRQRIGFAVALCGDPKILILDEPMSGLDPMGRRRIRDLILHAQQSGKTIFFSSHVLGDVQQICNRVAIMNRGRLYVEGRLDELLGRRTNEIEVIMGGMQDALAQRLKAKALRTRRSEDGHHFYVSKPEDANAIVKVGLDNGARLVEFIPVRETLEDYFVRIESETEST
jgi:ABC-2 type transport system ATP-binding protein